MPRKIILNIPLNMRGFMSGKWQYWNNHHAVPAVFLFLLFDSYLKLHLVRSIMSAFVSYCSSAAQRWCLPSVLYNAYRARFPGVKRPGRGVDRPRTFRVEVKERVQLYLYSHSGPLWPVLGWIYSVVWTVVKARLHGSPRLINTVESMKLNSTVELMKLNSTVERYCLHGSTKVNEAVDFKMAANELVREGVVICDYLTKECQHILEKRNKREKTVG